jgi:hypothetical protein
MMSSGGITLQIISNLLGCGRRNQPCSTSAKVKQPTQGKGQVAQLSDVSRRIRADESTTEGSDSDAASQETETSALMPSSHGRQEIHEAHQPIKPPPGLEPLVKQPIRPIPGREHPAALKLPRAEQFPTVITPPDALDEVLKKLSPNDANVVRRLFENREQAKAPHPKAKSSISMSGQAQQTQHDGAFQKVPSPIPEGIDPSGDEGSLRSNLKKMKEIDEERIFMVRGIGKLGLNSANILREHFTQIGIVQEVFVTHAFNRKHTSMRAAQFGFIAMEKAEDVRSVLQCEQHEILGVSVAAKMYERAL